ncbi:MAG: hypothetical protein KGJ02_07095 [Verrucomicrobiota bacterium]|nr:hypothetical protein [Verrucomicrobiota bacterium]
MTDAIEAIGESKKKQRIDPWQAMAAMQALQEMEVPEVPEVDPLQQEKRRRVTGEALRAVDALRTLAPALKKEEISAVPPLSAEGVKRAVEGTVLPVAKDKEGKTIKAEVEKLPSDQISRLAQVFQRATEELEEKKTQPVGDELPNIEEVMGEAVDVAAKKENFPHPARDIMELAMKAERFQMTHRFRPSKEKGKEYSANIDQLLKLSAKVNTLASDADEDTVDEEMRAHIEALRLKDIDVLPGELKDRKLKKEDLVSLKSQIGYHIDVQRSKVQELFSGDLSIAVQFMQTLHGMMQAISNNHRKGGETLVGNQRSH